MPCDQINALFSFLVAAGLSACAAETSGPPPSVESDFRLTLGSDGQQGEALVTADASGTAFSVEAARAHVRHVEFYLPGDTDCGDLAELPPRVICEDHGESDDGHVDDDPQADASDDGNDDHGHHAKLRLVGSFVFDLISGEATPSLAGLVLPDVAYRRVDVRFDDEDGDVGLSPGDALVGHTVHLTGTTEFDGAEVPFDLRLQFNEDARFEQEQGVFLDAAVAGGAELDLSAWFSALPITTCLLDGDLRIASGQLSIDDDENECGDLEGALKDAIKGTGRLR